MTNVQIIVPKEGSVKTLPGPLVVSGRAGESIVGVYGECRTTPDDGRVIKGLTFSFLLDGARPGHPRSHLWAIVFRVPGPGTYRLTIHGLSASCDKVQHHRDITVKAPEVAPAGPPYTASHVHPKPIADRITIHDLGNGEDITDQKDNFVASGDLTRFAPTSVTLTDENSGATIPDYVAYDLDFQFWIAQFASIPTGSYRLDAIDPESHVTRSGLTVN